MSETEHKSVDGAGAGVLSGEVNVEVAKRRIAWTRPAPEQLFYYGVYLCLSILFTDLYFKSLSPYRRATLYALTTFHADTPFQYRVLMPCLAAAIRDLIGIHLYPLYSILTAISTFGLLLAFRRYLMLFISEKAASLGCLMILYPMLWNYCALPGYYFPCDVPAILFFVVGLTLIYTERWSIFFPLFIVASFNRETSCFLIFAYAFTMLRNWKGSRYWLHITVMGAIWLGIKILMRVVFQHNGGAGTFENQITNNYCFIKDLFLGERHAMMRLYTFGFVWVPAVLYWKKQPQFFKRLFWVYVPFLIGMSIVGRLQEVRIYAELLPIMVAPAVYSAYLLLGDKPKSANLEL